MNITMTITADTPVELFSTIKGCNAMIAAECPVATPDKPETGKPVSPAPVSAPMPTAPLAEPPKFTFDEVAKAGGEFAQNDNAKRDAIINLLHQFGVDTVTQLKEEQLGPFAMALRGLGAKI